MTLLGVVQQLILPSLFTPIIIFFGLLLTFRKKNLKVGRVIIIIGLALYCGFSITPVADLLLEPLERDYKTLQVDRIEEADKIVLLLGGRESDVLRASEVLKLAHLTDHRAKIIISGTDPSNPKSEEAIAVKRFFVARGIPSGNIVIEGRSRNTWENVRNIAELTGEESFFLVTSAYHMKRSMREFERVGANPIPAPMDFRVRGEYGIYSYLPNAQHLRNSDLAIHEYFGILFYNFL